MELKRLLGVCYLTASLLKRTILSDMRLAEADRRLTSRVKSDDEYLGGERSGGKASALKNSFNAVNNLIGNVKTAGTGMDAIGRLLQCADYRCGWAPWQAGAEPSGSFGASRWTAMGREETLDLPPDSRHSVSQTSAPRDRPAARYVPAEGPVLQATTAFV